MPSLSTMMVGVWPPNDMAAVLWKVDKLYVETIVCSSYIREKYLEMEVAVACGAGLSSSSSSLYSRLPLSKYKKSRVRDPLKMFLPHNHGEDPFSRDPAL